MRCCWISEIGERIFSILSRSFSPTQATRCAKGDSSLDCLDLCTVCSHVQLYSVFSGTVSRLVQLSLVVQFLYRRVVEHSRCLEFGFISSWCLFLTGVLVRKQVNSGHRGAVAVNTPLSRSAYHIHYHVLSCMTCMTCMSGIDISK